MGPEVADRLLDLRGLWPLTEVSLWKNGGENLEER